MPHEKPQCEAGVRLWTVHPRYLDAKGIVAAWREALLAQKVLTGLTKGYQHHPQLIRFQAQKKPVQALATFLVGLADEADARGYSFDRSKISRPRFTGSIETTEGQLLYEWRHLLTKLKSRDPKRYKALRSIKLPDAHPLFRVVPGDMEAWEKVS